jgi:hypothetical protein
LQQVHYDVVLHRDDHQEVELNDEPLDVVHHHVRTMRHCVMHHRHLRPCCATQRRVMQLHPYVAMLPLVRPCFRRGYLYCVHLQGDLEVPS